MASVLGYTVATPAKSLHWVGGLSHHWSVSLSLTSEVTPSLHPANLSFLAPLSRNYLLPSHLERRSWQDPFSVGHFMGLLLKANTFLSQLGREKCILR